MQAFRRVLAVLCAASVLSAVSCSNNSGNSEATPSDAASTVSAALKYDISVDYSDEDLSGEYDDATAAVKLSDSGIEVNGEGVSADGNTATVTASGAYVFSGSIADGRIIVNSPDEGTVRLVFNGIDLTSATSAPVYIVAADKCIITLADGTQNKVTDRESYIYDDAQAEEPNAAIFSKDDLIINGNGSLDVTGKFNNGIQSKDELKITGGSITVNAVNNAVKGKDCVGIAGGTLDLTAGGNGIISDNTEDTSLGFIAISDGNINVSSAEDAIQAESCLLVSGGNITAVAGGGNTNGATHTDSFGGGFGGGFGGWGDFGGNTTTSTDDVSAKGLKAGIDVSVTGGSIDLDTADDAVHSDASISINDGRLTLASGDDGIHAETDLTVNGGQIDITICYEGIEGATITFNAGTTHINSDDDGINATDGNAGGMGGMGGFGGMQGNSAAMVYFNGGYVYMNANGDGFDSNGSIVMSGGTMIVDGPTNGGNGAIDYGTEFTMSGGLLIAAGSSGMAETVSSSSTQYCLALTFSSKTAQTIVHVENENGESVVTYAPSKQYQSVVICSPDIKKDGTYNIYTGGTCDGSVTDGLYSGGNYSGGTQEFTLTASSVVTANAGGGMGGMGGFGGGDHGGGPGGMGGFGGGRR